MAFDCTSKFPITITVVIDDVAGAIGAGFDQIQIHRSVSGEGGPYAELTTNSTRIDLVASQSTYEFDDPEGSEDYFYKFRLFNSTTLATDTFSDPEPGKPDAALDICSVEELKSFYLFGVDLTDDDGNEFPPSLFAHYIKSSVDWLEHKLMIQIKKQVIEEERLDYFRDDYDKYIWLELDNFPVISIEEVKLVLPGEQVVQVFDKDWIHIKRESGQLQLVPGTGTAGSILLGASGAWLPLIYGNNRFVPDAFRVKYTAGFGKPPAGSYGFPLGTNPPSVSVPDSKLDRVPQKIKEVVGKMASFGPFNIAGDLIVGAGIASTSLSIDGLSQSVNTTSSATNSGYGSRLVQYKAELKDEIPQLARYYNGIRLQVV